MISLCVKASTSDVYGIFNVGSGLGYSVKQIISSIESVTGLKATINYMKPRLFDVKSVVLDISDTQDKFSWSTQYNLIQGIGKYHDELVISNKSEKTS